MLGVKEQRLLLQALQKQASSAFLIDFIEDSYQDLTPARVLLGAAVICEGLHVRRHKSN